MGTLNSKPNSVKVTSDGVWNNLKYALSSMQGWRTYMEDFNCHYLNLPHPFEKWAFFGIFDGHGGSQASAICSSELIYYILGTDYFKSIDNDENIEENKLIDSIIEAFRKLDETLSDCREGTTVTAVFVTPKYFIFINCGDSRSILIRDSIVHFSTTDHKPNNDSEKERIIKAGGQVISNRLNGNLSVSRTLGDSLYKKSQELDPQNQLISPDPDVTLLKRDDERDHYIILASDGLWDVFENDSLALLTNHRLQCLYQMSTVAEDLLDVALYKGSKDNISIVMLVFEKAPKLNEMMESNDRELDETIVKKATEYLYSQGSDSTLISLTHHLNKLKFDNLPPGGFVTKQKLITDVFEKYVSSKSLASEEFIDHSKHYCGKE